MGKQSFNFNVNKLLLEEKEEHLMDSGAVGGLARKIESPIIKSPLEEYKIIPRNKLRENKKNSYPQGSLDSLKETILDYGVQQDITAIYIMDEDFYVIEAGHRRKASVDLLIEEFEDYEGNSEDARYLKYLKNVKKYEFGYVCKITGTIKENITYDLEDEDNLADASNEVIDSEIRLHITNIQARNDDNGVRASNIARLSKLYDEKNKRNPNKINVNKQIAADLNITDRQVKYYKSLDNLIPELREEFDKNKITIKDGSNYAKLSESEQKMILSLIQSGAQNVSKEQVNALQQEKSILVKKVVEKEMQLQLLQDSLESEKTRVKEQKNPDDEKIEKIKEKDGKINTLQKEIENLKMEMKSKKEEKPNPEITALIQTDLQLKTTMGEAEKIIKKLLDLSNHYKIMIDKNGHCNGLAIFTEYDCNRELEYIKNLL